MRLTHNSSKKFVFAFDDDLGRVDIANVRWEYDHELNPLNFAKVCVLLCSDAVYVDNVAIKRLLQSQP